MNSFSHLRSFFGGVILRQRSAFVRGRLLRGSGLRRRCGVERMGIMRDGHQEKEVEEKVQFNDYKKAQDMYR
ncbi:unnamed protein product, partial [Ilex paraguariensis]